LTLANEAGEINRQSDTIRTAVNTAVHRNDDTTAVPLSTSWYYKLVWRIVTAAHYDFQRERPLIAVPSLLEGALAPHRGAPSAF
jgi:hypothetical protein